MKHYITLGLQLILAFQLHLNAQDWIPLGGPLGVNIKYSIISKHTNQIFVLTSSGEMFLSSNLGGAWENISSGLNPKNSSLNYSKIVESNDGKLFLYLSNSFYEYDDTNKTWILKNSNIELEDFTIGPNGYIYGGNYNHMYISKDDGLEFINKANWFTHTVYFECKGANHNYVRQSLGASYSLHTFDDEGNNLTSLGSIDYTNMLVCHSSTGNLINLSYDGLHFSTNGKTWKLISIPGFPNYNINFIMETPDGDLLALGTTNFISKDGGLNWTKDNKYQENINSIDYASVTVNQTLLYGVSSIAYVEESNSKENELLIPINKPTIYTLKCFGQNNILCRTHSYKKTQFSTDDGKSWRYLDRELVPNYPDADYIDSDGNYYIFTFDSLYLYNLHNGSFLAKSYPNGVTLYPESAVLTRSNKLVISDYNLVYISNDKGSNWQVYKTNNNNNSNSISCSSNDILYVQGYDSMYYSNDLGINWFSFPLSGLPSPYNYSFLSRNNIFYWYSDNGISTYLYSSDDFGKTSQIEDSLNFYNLIQIDEYDTKYYSSDSGIIIKPRGIGQEERISYSGLNLQKYEYPNFVLGENGYMYAYFQNKVLYKTTHKVVNERGRVTGKIILDDNQNCAIDPADTTKIQWNLVFENPNRKYNIATNSNGEFSFSPQLGEYSMSLKTDNLLWAECNPSYSFKIDGVADTTLSDFMVKPLDICPYLKTDVSMSRLRRCFDNNQATVSICNSGTEDAKNTTVYLKFDNFFENITASQNPVSKIGNEWYYEIPEIKRGHCIRLQFQFRISCNARLGDIHCLRAISKNSKECNSFLPLIDTSVLCSPNLGSFDPNDKMAFVNNTAEDQSILPNQDLTYLIRFQNTGTDTAFKVAVKDRLSEYLDWSSLKIVSSSHDFTYTLDPGGLLELTFNNIMLPDSNISHENSNGFFKYTIKQKKDLKPGTQILNDASIYFDYNAPVLTNLTHLTVNTITRTSNLDATVYSIKATPNPFQTETHLKLPVEFQGRMKKWTVVDVSGTKILEYTNKEQEIVIQGNLLHNGFYLVSVIADNQLRAIGKIVVCK